MLSPVCPNALVNYENLSAVVSPATTQPPPATHQLSLKASWRMQRTLLVPSSDWSQWPLALSNHSRGENAIASLSQIAIKSGTLEEVHSFKCLNLASELHHHWPKPLLLWMICWAIQMMILNQWPLLFDCWMFESGWQPLCMCGVEWSGVKLCLWYHFLLAFLILWWNSLAMLANHRSANVCKLSIFWHELQI